MARALASAERRTGSLLQRALKLRAEIVADAATDPDAVAATEKKNFS